MKIVQINKFKMLAEEPSNWMVTISIINNKKMQQLCSDLVDEKTADEMIKMMKEGPIK